MIEVEGLMGIVFLGLSVLVVEDAARCSASARGPGRTVGCPGCGTETARVHQYWERTAADVPADGWRVLVKVRVRIMRCPVTGPRQTFRERSPAS